jgi:hypothetical protein
MFYIKIIEYFISSVGGKEIILDKEAEGDIDKWIVSYFGCLLNVSGKIKSV